jgi:diadenosine tetraphosphatase ApaH/serine/threonine PP2A family protein phosphatase
MLIALFSDIHANREALTACLAHAKASGAEHLVFLGDLVGYGADPVWVVETVAELCAKGAVCVLGNHDAAVFKPDGHMNMTAATAINWTRGELQSAHKDFLAGLELSLREDDRLYVHASPKNPASWPYVASAEDAAIALSATTARIAFCGHLHQQALFGVTATGKLASFNPKTASPVPLLKPRRWLVRLGAVGQPRDHDPSAAFCLFDTQTSEIRFIRVPYDVESAMAKIRAAGLPESLALRLAEGR